MESTVIATGTEDQETVQFKIRPSKKDADFIREFCDKNDIGYTEFMVMAAKHFAAVMPSVFSHILRLQHKNNIDPLSNLHYKYSYNGRGERKGQACAILRRQNGSEKHKTRLEVCTIVFQDGFTLEGISRLVLRSRT